MNAQKVMIIVLVVIVMLFVVTLAMGGSHGGGSTDNSDPVHFLKGLQSKRFLKLGDKAAATCGGAGQQQLVFANQCVITIDKRGFLGAPTRVVLTANAPLGVKVEPKKGPSQDDSVDPGKCYQTAVDPGGGTVTLAAAGNVTVTLLEQGCPQD